MGTTLSPELPIGYKSGMLTVNSERRWNHNGERRVFYYECVCDCGKTKEIKHADIKHKMVGTCGCISNKLRSESIKKSLKAKKTKRVYE